MKKKSTIALAMAICSGVAHAGEIYDGYDAFFNAQAGQVFSSPVSKDYLPARYASNGDATASWQGRAGRKRIRVEVTSRDIQIDRLRYAFADAVRLPGDDGVEVDPRSVTLYLAPGADAASPDVCIESTFNGSGTADRYSEVYAIASRSRAGARLFKLPSLFGSCLSLVRQQGALQFPIFSYRRVANIDDPVGNDVQYFAIHGGRYVRTERHLSTRFAEPSNVFRFTVE